jgi:lipoprotein-anchoring transpeptidase ErfK/SrfK
MMWTLVSAFVILSAQQPAAPPQRALREAIGIQVALDRAGFSSGVIDGRMGANTLRARDAYRRQHGSDPAAFPEPLVEYRITSADVAGPFAPDIPPDLMAQSRLPALAYRSPAELLAERFHTTPEVLRRLNPSARFEEGTLLRVPNVEPLTIIAPESRTGATASEPHPTGTAGRADGPGAPRAEKAEVVVQVSRSTRTLTVTSAGGKIVFFAPVTTGSENDPLPLGEWKVNGVQYNPTFRYNPDLFWDADPSHTKATIPPGPNGPVGLVWIDISKEHYGLHGTPEPALIGRAESHGCVRLTNWDALRLAALVRPGTRVVFAE